MNSPEWFQDPRVRNIDPAKLALLLNLAEQVQGKSQRELMPIVAGAMASANRQKLRFSKEEFDLIFEIMKEGKSKKEQQDMDSMLHRAQALLWRNQKG